MASYIRTSDHLTIVFDDGATANVYNNNPRLTDVIKALAKQDYETVRRIALPATAVKQQVADFGISAELVTIEHGVVSFKGSPMHNTLTDRMLSMLSEGFDINPLKLFLINLQNNPSYRAVNELYGFLERGNLPITEDGHFLAYKKVRNDYRDVHSGTVLNKLANGFTSDERNALPMQFGRVVVDIENGVTVVSMQRNDVDEDSRNDCSNGLHFCSKDYLGGFGGQVILTVKINPADVVAIPVSETSKGRACKYQIIAEADGSLEGTYRATNPNVTTLVDDWMPEVDWDEDEEQDDEETDDAEQEFFSTLGGALDHMASAFVGIPGDGEPVVVPHDVALAIAKSLDEDESDLEPVVAVSHEYNRMLSFDDITEAAEFAGVSVSAIRRVLRGDRKSTGGYGWVRPGTTVTFTGKGTKVDSTLPDSSALAEHKKHGTLFGGTPHETGTKDAANKTGG